MLLFRSWDQKIPAGYSNCYPRANLTPFRVMDKLQAEDMGYAEFIDMSPLAAKTSASSGCNHDDDDKNESCDEHSFDLHTGLCFMTMIINDHTYIRNIR
jgi:hypothetical protein